MDTTREEDGFEPLKVEADNGQTTRENRALTLNLWQLGQEISCCL
jgi:hypothetical protein